MTKNADELAMAYNSFRTSFQNLKSEIGKVIVGQEEIVEGLLTALTVGGHVLLEGVPGLGKTLLVRTLAKTLDTKFSKIQFTPDLMPADLIGTNVLTEKENGHRGFEFQPGPVFTNLLLADEINRATPRTQSALLEAMQEKTVTVAGKTRALESPFFVMATQNPIEMEGTYPLPEAQLDRFLFKLDVPFPDAEQMQTILSRTTSSENATVETVCSAGKICAMNQIVRQISIADEIQQKVVDLVFASHPEHFTATSMVKRFVRYGSSPRGAQGLVLAAKVKAILDERFHVATEDIVAVAKIVLRHRILLNFLAQSEQIQPDDVIDEMMQTIL